MLDIIVNAVNLGFAGLIMYNVYWQSQIDVKANYAYWQLIWGGIITVWMASTGIRSWSYVIFMALFILLNVSAGVSGLGERKIVGRGFYSRFFSYDQFAAVTLTPITAPNGREIVIGIFALNPQRYMRLTFQMPLETIMHRLQERLPESVPVTIQRIN